MKVRTAVLMIVALILASRASAQVSITGGIAGTVTDSSAAVVPGASVLLKDEGTGIQKSGVTDKSGAFAFRDLSFGTYEVTVKLQGFQTVVYKAVVVESGRTTDLQIKLAVVSLETAVTVEGATPVLEVTSNQISSSMSNKDINQLPLGSRDAFGFARLVPGTVAPAGTGSTHYNGMPGGTINPTIDGVNNSSNGFKSGGTSFFDTVPARLGAIEEMTVESAGLDGDSGVTGGVNLKFVTKRGTNKYRGSVFEQYRTEKLNANSFSNVLLGRSEDKFRRHDFGGNFGGPIVRSGPLAGKMFGFFNIEQAYIPQTTTRNQTILTEEARSGIFRYTTSTGEQRTVNLLTLAGANGFQSTLDPTISTMLAKEATSRQYGTVASITNSLRTETINWSEPQEQNNYYPTFRFDYQIKQNLAFMSSYNRYNQRAQGRRIWPFPDYPIQADTFDSGWWITSNSLNWTLGPNKHNEAIYGIQHSGDTNERGRERDLYLLNGSLNGLPARFTLPLGITTLANDADPVIGAHYITTISDTFTLIRGDHTWSFGGNYRDTQWRDRSFDGAGTAGWLGLPRYSLNIATGDPISSLFTSANIPGLQANDTAAVGQLYALLTGRISAVQTGRVVDPASLQYSDQVFRENWTSAWFAGVFIQDKWRVTPRLTFNYGFRWEFQQPPYNHTGTTAFPDDANLLGPSTALFQPGVLNGVTNPVSARAKKAAGTDWVNPAPKFGFAWQPNFSGGILGKIFGEGQDTVIRGGYDLTYYDEGTNMFASIAGNNIGQSQTLLLQPGSPGFTPGGLTLQSALPPFVASPLTYKDQWFLAETTFGTTGFGGMKHDIRAPYTQAWNIGVQRLIAKNTVIEVRYLGNRSTNVWNTYNLNEVNIFENNFLTDFKSAQRNLAINEANGIAGSFQNNNLPGQVAIPILDTAFGARGSQAALPANQGYTNGNFVSDVRLGEAGRLAGRLAGSSTYMCRLVGNTFSPCLTGGRNFDAPGPYPINFFQANPYAIGGALNYVDDNSFSRYNALQLQLRRRYTNGLTANVNYTLAKNINDIWADNATQSHNYRTLRDKSLDEGPSPFDVRHVLQAFGTYELPFGKGRRYSTENGFLDGVFGGWVLGGILTAQSGTPFRLTSGRQTVNGSDGGVVLMNGHTIKEIQSMIQINPGPVDAVLGKVVTRYWVDPKLVGPDGRANPEYLAVPTTPGEFGQLIYLRGKNTWNIDMSLVKTTQVYGRYGLTLHFTIQNLLNHPVWSTPGFLGETNVTATNFGISTAPINGARGVFSRFEFRF